MRPMSAVLRALCTPRRREILHLVWDGERSVGAIQRALPDQVSIATVSEHLHVLSAAGLVSSRSAGRFRYYRAEREALGPLAEWLESLWAGALERLTLQAELEASRRGPRPRRRSRKPGQKGRTR